jgi:hypothetical protein
MEILSNIIFKTSKKYLFEELKNINVFDRNIDLMIYAVSIGINGNTWREPKGDEIVEVTRSTLTNYEISESLDFLFKTAILTCDIPFIKLSDDDRLRLAFDLEYKIDGFEPMKLLLGFLSTGLDVIEEEIYTKVPEDVIENIQYLTNILIDRDHLTEDIIRSIVEKEIQDY